MTDSVTMTYNRTSSDSCELVFKSDVEGIATTYANLYRRSLLQSTPIYSVAATRCKYNGNYANNFFEIIPGLTGSLLEINTMLTKAVFDIKSEDSDIVLSLPLTQKTMLSNVCDLGKVSVLNGDIDEISLVSQDKILATVVGTNHVIIDIYIRKGVGYIQKDLNKIALEEVVGADGTEHWMVIDSQHRGVVSVGYHNEVRLGKQIITLDVKSHQSNIDEVIKGCTKNIADQMNVFLKSL